MDDRIVYVAELGAIMDEDLRPFRARLEQEFAAMVDLLIEKRRSYGATNLTRFGPIGIVIRASDKIDRLATMIGHGTRVSADGDTIDDAWRDLIGYGVLGLLDMQDRASARADVVSATPAKEPSSVTAKDE